MSEQSCPYCGAEWSAEMEMRFCGQCGSKLGALSPEITNKERRTLTVLFADLSGFTAFSAGRDPETVEELVDELLGTLGGVVESYGGYVDKYMGDAVMAIFGAPNAHEDDPLRAVRTGLELLDVVAEFDEDLTDSPSLSVGINTGEVLWSQVGGGDYTVTGDAVNVAQRLEAEASEGSVLVSRAVQHRTAGQVSYRPQGAIELDGRDSPVRSYVAEQLEPGQTGGGKAGDVRAPLRGRDAELTRLSNRYEEPAPSFVAVTGPAGMGKSRLLEAFRSEVTDGPSTPVVGVGRCTEHADLPLEPFGEYLLSRADVGRGDPDAGRQVVRTVVEDLDEAASRPEQVAHLLAISIGLDASDTQVTELPPERMEAALHRAWVTWIRALAREQPVVLCLEDLQSADDATRQLLAVLRERLLEPNESRHEPITIVGATRRKRDVPDGYETISLAPLSEADARRIAETVLDGAIDPELSDLLFEQSGGNPYFLEELLRYLRDHEQLERTDDTYRLATNAPETVQVPETLEGLLVGRIDALEPEVRETLKGASVIGRQFWVGVLGETLQCEPHDAVDTLVDRGLIQPCQESTLPDDREYVFEHALVRDATYELLPRSARQELHAAVSTELERIARERIPADRSTLALAARQAAEADDHDRAGTLWTDAAERAIDDDAYQEAITYAEQALETPVAETARLQLAQACKALARHDRVIEIVEDIDTNEDGAVDRKLVTRAQLLRAEVLSRQGAYEDAIELIERVAEVADGAVEARARLRAGAALSRLTRYDEAREQLRTAEARLETCAERTETVRLEAELRRELGNLEQRRDAYEAANEHFEASLALARECDDALNVARALTYLGIVSMHQKTPETAIERLEESLAINREIGDRYGEAGALTNLGLAASKRNDWEDAMQYYEQGLQLFEEVGDEKGAAVALNNLGDVALQRGHLDTATEYYEESLEITREIGDRQAEGNSRIALGLVALRRDVLETAEEHFETGLAIKREIGERKGEAMALTGLGAVTCRRGALATAEDHVEEGLEIAREIDNRDCEARSLAVLSEIAERRGDSEHAEDRFDAAVEAAPNDGTVNAMLHKLDIDGIVDDCERRGDDQVAAAWCDRAIDLAERIGDEEREQRYRRRRADLSATP